MSRSTADSSRTRAHSARLREGPAPELVQAAFQLEINDALVLWPGLTLSDLAHAVMLIEQRIVPKAAGASLLGLLLELHEIPVGDFPLDPNLEDVTSNREHWLRQRDEEAAGWLGAGRARREPATVAYRVAARRRLLQLLEGVVSLCDTLTNVAEQHVATLMPDYTYLQHAQPTSLAHYLLSFAYPLLRDVDRLRACFERMNQCPAGIGSINGSRLPVDRQRLADLVGFDGVITNTRDAMWQVDGPVEVTAAVTALGLHVDRLAEDLQIWNTAEFDLVELADRHARASFIMPQKKNPYSLAYVRGMTGNLLGKLVSMAAIGRGPSAQMDNRVFAIGEVARTLDLAINTVHLMAGVVHGLRFHHERMRSRTSVGYGQATDLAEGVMQRAGVNYRTAHRVVASAIRMAIDRGSPPGTLPPDILADAARQVLGSPVTLPEDLHAALTDPGTIVATRTGIGGAAPDSVRTMIAECRQRMAEARTWQEDRRARLEAAESALVKRARELAAA